MSSMYTKENPALSGKIFFLNDANIALDRETDGCEAGFNAVASQREFFRTFGEFKSVSSDLYALSASADEKFLPKAGGEVSGGLSVGGDLAVGGRPFSSYIDDSINETRIKYEDKLIKIVNDQTGLSSQIAADDFIKDGMIDSVSCNVSGDSGHPNPPYVVITWNTEAGKDQTWLPVKDFAILYKTDDPGVDNDALTGSYKVKLDYSYIARFSDVSALQAYATELSAPVVGTIAALSAGVDRALSSNVRTVKFIGHVELDDEVSSKTFAELLDRYGNLDEEDRILNGAMIEVKAPDVDRRYATSDGLVLGGGDYVYIHGHGMDPYVQKDDILASSLLANPVHGYDVTDLRRFVIDNFAKLSGGNEISGINNFYGINNFRAPLLALDGLTADRLFVTDGATVDNLSAYGANVFVGANAFVGSVSVDGDLSGDFGSFYDVNRGLALSAWTDCVDTVVTFDDGSVSAFCWKGEVNGDTMVDSGLFDKNVVRWIKHPVYVEIGSGVTGIGENAFNGCQSLSAVSIPNGVRYIGHSSFNGCAALAGIDVPYGVAEIGAEAFKGCTGLVSATVPGSVAAVGYDAFRGCSSLSSLDIRDGVGALLRGAFAGCSHLSSVAVPGSVMSVEKDAFAGCNALTSVVLREGVEQIGEGAFYNCGNLKSITVPASVLSIGGYAFQNAGISSAVFEGKTLSEVSGMANYTWGLPPSAISAGDQWIVEDIAGLSGEIDSLSTALSGEIDTLSAKLSGEIDSLSTALSGEIDNLSTALSGEINTLSAKLSGEIDSLSAALSAEISARAMLSVDGEPVQDFRFLHISQDDYHDLVLGKGSGDYGVSCDPNTLYVVSSDVGICMYGKRITDMAPAEDEYDAATYGQLLSAQSQTGSISADLLKLKADISGAIAEALPGAALEDNLSVQLSAVVKCLFGIKAALA